MKNMKMKRRDRVIAFTAIVLPVAVCIIGCAVPETGEPAHWVAVGSDGDIRYSVNNGANWQPGVSGTTDSLRGLARDRDGNWIAVGDEGTNGIVLYSSDGRTWGGEADLSPNFLLGIACD